MFEATSVMRLFPTALWVHTLSREDSEALNGAILGELEPLIAEDALSATGHWQSEAEMHKREGFTAMTYYAETATQQALEFLHTEARDAAVTDCWVEVTAPGGPPVPVRTQSENFLSGLYFVSVAEGSDEVHAFDPRPQTDAISPAVTQRTEYNTRRAMITVRPGTLLLFPAWLARAFPENRSDQRRIVVGFDVMLGASTV